MTTLSSNPGASQFGTPDAFHLAVGRAIRAWGSIEGRLQETFAICLSFSPPRGAGFIRINPFAISILDAVEDMSAKLRLVEAAVGSALRDIDRAKEIGEEWTASRRKIASLEQYVGFLIHWEVVQDLDDDGQIAQVMLRPRRFNTTGIKPLTIGEVETCERRFLSAAQRLTRLNEKIAASFDRQRAHVIEFAEQLRSANSRDALVELLDQEIGARKSCS